MNSAANVRTPPSTDDWDASKSAELYGINDWGAGYFQVADNGDMQVCVDTGGQRVAISVPEIVEGMRARGLHMPAVLRIENILDHRIKALNEAFAKAIADSGYQNQYRGVFPIKVNQQYQVIDEIASYGQRFHHGFEAGSKAELTIALTQLHDHQSLIVCNGYKDAEFIDLGLYARQIGIQCFFVLETLAELPIILERSHVLGIEPLIGLRIKSTVEIDGHWSEDCGDRSIFGLSTAALLAVVDELKRVDKLHCLQLLHCHFGSQIPNIRNVRNGVLEACRVYAGLVSEGAPLTHLDLGGGLAVDYEGTRTNTTNSMNYQLGEYCANIVETIREILDPLEIPHPVIVSESGRATVAYSSMLLFNILDVRNYQPLPMTAAPDADSPEALKNIFCTLESLNQRNFQECYNDSFYYRDEVRELFYRGGASLRERAMAENIHLAVMQKIAQLLPQLDRVPPELEQLPDQLSDIYYGNFSLFQSLPDIWAIDQLFPIAPIHRLHEYPSRQAILADLTCDCDGKIDRFATPAGHKPTLPLHPIRNGEDYYVGVFLVGAYQETLGDLHNLFGDTNVVSVQINADGSFHFAREFRGDSIADVLSYVEYNPKQMEEQFRSKAEAAVREGRINVGMRQQMLNAFRDSLSGYTYFEHH